MERFKREGLVRNVATDGDGTTHSTTKANLQLIPLFDKSDLVRALPFDAKVVEAVGQLIGEPFLLHLDQMFLKPARHGVGTAWHQDNAYFRIADPLRGTAMWIAIHDATLANGTLHLIPGSHRERYEHRRDPRLRPPHPRLAARGDGPSADRACGWWRRLLLLRDRPLHARQHHRLRTGRHGIPLPARRLRVPRAGRGRPPHPSLRDRRHEPPAAARSTGSRSRAPGNGKWNA